MAASGPGWAPTIQPARARRTRSSSAMGAAFCAWSGPAAHAVIIKHVSSACKKIQKAGFPEDVGNSRVMHPASNGLSLRRAKRQDSAQFAAWAARSIPLLLWRLRGCRLFDLDSRRWWRDAVFSRGTNVETGKLGVVACVLQQDEILVLQIAFGLEKQRDRQTHVAFHFLEGFKLRGQQLHGIRGYLLALQIELYRRIRRALRQLHGLGSFALGVERLEIQLVPFDRGIVPPKDRQSIIAVVNRIVRLVSLLLDDDGRRLPLGGVGLILVAAGLNGSHDDPHFVLGCILLQQTDCGFLILF